MATATSPWAKPGAWALESESLSTLNPNDLSSEPSPDFPSLSTAAASKPSKKKKPQPLSFAEFAGGKPVGPGTASRAKGLTKDELLTLPTGPRERSAEELERPSRGFSYRASGDDLKKNSGFSRADEAGDWGSMKKPVERRERGGGFFDEKSRADEVDSWVSKREKSGGFERKKEKDGFFRTDSESWGRRKEEGSAGGRPRLVLQPRTVPLSNGNMEVNNKGLNPFGLARPREEVLAEKGKDWKKIDGEMGSMALRERGSDEVGLGRRGRGLGDGSLCEDRTKGSWRKEVASDATAEMSGFFMAI